MRARRKPLWTSPLPADPPTGAADGDLRRRPELCHMDVGCGAVVGILDRPQRHLSHKCSMRANSCPTWLPACLRRRAGTPPTVGVGNDQTGEPDLEDAEEQVVRPGLTDEVADADENVEDAHSE